METGHDKKHVATNALVEPAFSAVHDVNWDNTQDWDKTEDGEALPGIPSYPKNGARAQPKLRLYAPDLYTLHASHREVYLIGLLWKKKSFIVNKVPVAGPRRLCLWLCVVTIGRRSHFRP